MSVGLAQASSQFGVNVYNGMPRSNDGSNHANDRQYSTTRDKARAAQSKHAHFASEASKAYKSGDKAQASAHSAKSKQYQSEAAKLNDEAASWVFFANNTDSAKDEIDLHGLYVKEVVIALDARIRVCQQFRQPILKAIVGKGLHSETHIAKLRPAVQDHCKELGIPTKIDPHNAGVVLIDVSNSGPLPPPSYPQPAAQGYSQPWSQGPQQPAYQQPAQQQPSHGINWCALLTKVVLQCLR